MFGSIPCTWYRHLKKSNTWKSYFTSLDDFSLIISSFSTTHKNWLSFFLKTLEFNEKYNNDQNLDCMMATSWSFRIIVPSSSWGKISSGIYVLLPVFCFDNSQDG